MHLIFKQSFWRKTASGIDRVLSSGDVPGNFVSHIIPGCSPLDVCTEFFF